MCVQSFIMDINIDCSIYPNLILYCKKYTLGLYDGTRYSEESTENCWYAERQEDGRRTSHPGAKSES